MRALVRQDHAVLVRLDPQGGDEALALALHTVGADVVLPQPPVRRLVLFDEHAGRTPVGEVARRLLLRVGQRQMDDVVRAASQVLGTLLVGDDVVGRRDDVRERGHVVAKGLEGTNAGHRSRR